MSNFTMEISYLYDFTKERLKPGADLGWGGHREHVPPSPILSYKKIQKHNINKIYQIEPRLKEMNCLMTIAEIKKTFSTFQFFHKHYWNSGSGKLIAAVRDSNLKRSELWKFITSLCALRKNNSSGTKAATEGCF